MLRSGSLAVLGFDDVTCCFIYFGFSVPTFTVVPEAVRSMSPLIVDSDEDDDSDDEDEDDDEDDDEPSEGVPIEQYRAWLGEVSGFIIK